MKVRGGSSVRRSVMARLSLGLGLGLCLVITFSVRFPFRFISRFIFMVKDGAGFEVWARGMIRVKSDVSVGCALGLGQCKV